MTNEVGWRFPPTGGGVAYGYNDPGIALFGGTREQSLARETIQNSLDAATRLVGPVHVQFDLHKVEGDVFGTSQLAEAVEACLSVADDEKAQGALEEALALLDKGRLTFLRIADHDTSGLVGPKFQALVKQPGRSVQTMGAGGSWGIGKSAPFTVSPLRTVFYWTRFEEDGEQQELFQGKAILMAHEANGEERQSTGFFGHSDKCTELVEAEIPSVVRNVDGRDPRRFGTSLWIPGFPGEDGWQERIARRVVASFFGAIQDDKLVVYLHPSSGMEERNLLTIEKSSLDQWFNYLASDDEEEVREAELFSNLLSHESTVDRQDQDLGHCRLWIRVAEGDEDLPSRVALMRKTGMLITTEQDKLKRFYGFRKFVAICRFEGDEGNELLRKMENPRHDQFEPDRIEGNPREQARGKRALARITKWIREEIRKRAVPSVSAESTHLSELARLLPDIEPEDPFGTEGTGDEGERSFGTAPTILLKPRRRPPTPPGGGQNDDDDDDDDDDDILYPNGDGGGGGVKPDKKKVKKKKDVSRAETIAVRDVRVVPTGTPGTYRVGFTPAKTGRAKLELLEAGDSSYVRRADLKTRNMTLEEGKRTEFEVVADEPMGNRAWLLSAVRLDG